MSIWLGLKMSSWSRMCRPPAKSMVYLGNLCGNKFGKKTILVSLKVYFYCSKAQMKSMMSWISFSLTFSCLAFERKQAKPRSFFFWTSNGVIKGKRVQTKPILSGIVFSSSLI